MEELWGWELRKAQLALRMMNRGIAVDRARRARFGFDLSSAQAEIHHVLEQIAPRDIAHAALVNKTAKPWWASPKQTLHLFQLLGLPLQNHRKTGNPTVDGEALSTLRRKAPEWTRLFNLLEDERSVDVFASTFIRAPLDTDGRMRCSFNIAGTETFRWSSSENAFGSGTNLQNIPKNQE
jgi:DNA polymerase I-like protein with 3'-5' exonuclease and polymerase domains